MVNIFVLVSYIVVHCKNKTVYKLSNDFYSREILEKNKYKSIMLLTIGTLLVFRLVPNSMIYILPLDTMLLHSK